MSLCKRYYLSHNIRPTSLVGVLYSAAGFLGIFCILMFIIYVLFKSTKRERHKYSDCKNTRFTNYLLYGSGIYSSLFTEGHVELSIHTTQTYDTLLLFLLSMLLCDSIVTCTTVTCNSYLIY